MDQQTLSRYPAGSLVRVAQIVGNPAEGVPALLPISQRTFWNWVKAGTICKGIKIGNVRAWRIEDVLAVAATAREVDHV